MSARWPRPIADPELEGYAVTHTTAPGAHLDAIAAATRAWSDYPAMMIDEVEGRLLALLTSLCGARRILEIGTFTGYSAVSMAAALPAHGELVTLELRPDHAAKARQHIVEAGLADVITVVEGPALDSLARLEGPFDLAFIDADKSGYPAYYDAVMPLMRPGALIVADNVLRAGRILDEASRDADTVGMRTFNDRVAADDRVEAVMLTVRDGISLIRVRG